ncbi:MAG: hypothetical protein KDA91_25220, partial [Planctomycetaceae bacterium]|nr:hypothetical protein [Planctomycetaceae bacterium]
YTLPEARDLINRHLLIRGYCIIQRGEILSVLKTKDLNPSLVPRVSAEELTDLPDHTLCKVSFDLNWLLADEAVEELKPMLSSAGQIHKLSRTNRLEILDVASSLRDIRDLLDAEQSQSGTEQLVRTFRLEHRRAEEVIVLLRDLLGIRDDKGSAGSGGMNPGMMQQMQQQMQQMQQQMQQQMASKAGGGTKAKGPAETRLVLNSRENMILAQAAPDQMAIIDQAIQQVDVAQESGRSLLNNMSRMKIYRLETVDPQTLSDLLQQLGDLDPGTVLKVDKSKKAIIAWASLADHLTITTLVEKLDQSGRSVEVIPLRRLEADYVAGTIRALMGPVEKDQTSNRNSSRYFVYGFGMPQQEEEDQSEGFKVEADIEFNRLLVFANNVEMEEIHNLLRKLGELPPKDQAFSGVQSFDLHPDEDLEQLRKRLEFLWQRDNELQFDLPESTTDEPADPPTEDDPAMDDPVVPKNDNQTTAASGASDRPRTFNELLTTRQNKFRSPRNATLDVPVRTRIPQRRPRNAAIVTNQPLQNPAATPQQETKGLRKGAELPNVRISVGPDGRLLVNTDDPEAMLEFEDLFKSISRSRPPYRVFTLKYATPSWVALNLDDYFKAEQETESSMQFDPWFGMRPVEKAVKGKNSLSRRRVPQFITDNFTSTILVRDADARQMQTIQELIELYDVPEPADTRAMRITKLFRLQNAKATSVANAVKDVFRDLLSSNDKALESNDKNQRPSGGFSSFLASMSDDSNEDEPIRFKGLLSIGVDESSNTLIVSSTASLMETLGQMIESLDEAANT